MLLLVYLLPLAVREVNLAVSHSVIGCLVITLQDFPRAKIIVRTRSFLSEYPSKSTFVVVKLFKVWPPRMHHI